MAHDSVHARRFLGLLVKQAREENEWDQQYLADELDIDIRTLRKIEAGKSNIGYNLLIKIIHTLILSGLLDIYSAKLGTSQKGVTIMGNKGRSEPNLFGGYTHYDSKGHKTGRTEPGFFGGYNHYDAKGNKIGHSDPGLFGGYNHYDAKGRKTGHSVPGAFGSYHHYDSKGHKDGRSDPVLGGYPCTNPHDRLQYW